jgi:hypothetical protein
VGSSGCGHCEHFEAFELEESLVRGPEGSWSVAVSTNPSFCFSRSLPGRLGHGGRKREL